MLASFAMSVAACAPSTVSVWIPAAPLDRVVEVLGRETSQILRCDGSLRGKIVALSLVEADAEEAMDRLADLVDGTWRLADGARVLVPDPAKKEATQAALIARRAEEASPFFKKLDELNGADYEPGKVSVALKNESQAARSGVAEGSPGGIFGAVRTQATSLWVLPVGRLTAKVVSSVPKESYLGLPPGGRVVFSTRPNRRQSLLPLDVAETERQWRADQDVALQAFARLSSGGPADESFGLESPMAPSRPVDRIQFSATRVDEWFVSAILGKVAALDAQGRALAVNSFTIWVGSGSELFVGIGGRPELKDRIELAELSRRQAAVAATLIGGTPAEAPADAVSLVSRPDLHEPLSLVPSDVLRQALQERHKNMIVEVPDDLVWLAFLADPSGATDFRLVDRILRTVLCDRIVESDDWLVARPADPEAAVMTRIPRAPLAKVCGQLRTGLGISLDDFADYVAARPPEAGASMLELFTLGAAGKGGFESDLFTGLLDASPIGAAAVRFFGRLNRIERANLLRTGSYRIDRAPPAMKSELEREALRAAAGLTSLFEEPEPTNFEPRSAALPPMYFEPTDAFAEGLPPASSVLLATKQERILLEPAPEPGEPWVEVSTDALAMRMAAARDPDAARRVLAGRRLPPLPVRLVVSQKATYTFTMSVAGRKTAGSWTFTERKPTNNLVPVAFTDLPRALLDEIKEKCEETLRAWKPGSVTEDQ